MSKGDNTQELANQVNADLGSSEPTSGDEIEAMGTIPPRGKRQLVNNEPRPATQAKRQRTTAPAEGPSTTFRIPKKLNSQVWPKQDRPAALTDDDIFDELERYELTHIFSNTKEINFLSNRDVALNAVMKEAENRLLAKKLELDQNKGKTLEKPDDAIKEIQTIAERDNASTLLADSRFSLRPEIVEPSAYWHRVQYKWPEVHRSLPLTWSGREHMVSSKTIELMHDLSNVIKVLYI